MSKNVGSGRPQPGGRALDEGPVEAAAREGPERTGLPRSAGGPVLGHSFAVVGSDAELLDVALPYLDAGLRAGDVVVLSASSETADLVARELGEGSRALRVDPTITLLGARAPDALARCGRYVDEALAGGVRLRALAEVQFGPEPEDWREGERFESVYSRLMGNAPAAGLCLYDTRRLPKAVVRGAAATHPLCADGAAWSANAAYRDPAEHLVSLPRPREPLEETAPVLVVENAPRLLDLRHQLAAVIAAWVSDPEQEEDLRLAAAEIAANAFRHGRPPVSARVWVDNHRMVCEITDSGTSFDDPFAGFLPAHGPDLGRGGMGLWLARKLWDHVDLIRRTDGFTVRLSTRLR
jgi:anti-sigma regulatory factor (Ser/Thr protein kinase)